MTRVQLTNNLYESYTLLSMVGSMYLVGLNPSPWCLAGCVKKTPYLFSLSVPSQPNDLLICLHASQKYISAACHFALKLNDWYLALFPFVRIPGLNNIKRTIFSSSNSVNFQCSISAHMHLRANRLNNPFLSHLCHKSLLPLVNWLTPA